MKTMSKKAGLQILAGFVLAVVMFVGNFVNAFATAETGSTMYVDGDNVNVREEASASSAKVTTLSSGHEVTITGTGQDSEGQTWYQISFTKDGVSYSGYIRHDFLTANGPAGEEAPEDFTEEVPEGTEGTEGTEEQVPTPEGTVDQGADISSAMATGSIIPTEGEGQPEVLPADFRSVYVRVNEQDIPAWADPTNEYYIFYATSPNGNSGWYLYDSYDGGFVRYQNFMAGSGAVSDNGDGDADAETGISPLMIVLIVLVVILVGVTAFLGMKVINNSNDDDEDYEDDDEDDYERPAASRRKNSFFSKISKAMSDDEEDYDDDDDDDYDDDDDEDYDDDEDDEEDDIPVVRRTQNGAVVRSAAPASSAQPARRPAGGTQVVRTSDGRTVVRTAQGGGQVIGRTPSGEQIIRTPDGRTVIRRPASSGQVVRTSDGRTVVRRTTSSTGNTEE